MKTRSLRRHLGSSPNDLLQRQKHQFHGSTSQRAGLTPTYRVSSEMCLHVSAAEIEADRENLKDSVFRIKHAAEWLYDAGDSMISLEQVRALLADPPKAVAGRRSAFCDFAGPG